MSDFSTYEEELRKNGKIIHTNVGVSMMPLLRQNRDVMIIERPCGRLKKYDCPLYVRRDGTHVLHRILKVRKNDYVICGDHCTKKEYGITDEDIIGVLTGIIRDGKEVDFTSFSYKMYYHLWCDFFYVRVFIIKAKSFFRRGFSFIKRRIFKKK
jgi:hypothetical protein